MSFSKHDNIFSKEEFILCMCSFMCIPFLVNLLLSMLAYDIPYLQSQ